MRLVKSGEEESRRYIKLLGLRRQVPVSACLWWHTHRCLLGYQQHSNIGLYMRPPKFDAFLVMSDAGCERDYSSEDARSEDHSGDATFQSAPPHEAPNREDNDQRIQYYAWSMVYGLPNRCRVAI
jgi:hypothetical protein